MFVFMDDSGDAPLPGMQDYFALTAIAFQTEASRDGMDAAISAIRPKWGKGANFEFKFTNLGDQRRTEFFGTIAPLPFKYSSCVLQKSGLRGQWTDKCYAYERVIREVVNGLIPHFRQVDEAQKKPLKIRVLADMHTDPDYLRLLQAEFGKLHAKDGTQMARRNHVKLGKSSSFNLLQLADLICGASRYATNAYRNQLSTSCLRIHELP